MALVSILLFNGRSITATPRFILYVMLCRCWWTRADHRRGCGGPSRCKDGLGAATPVSTSLQRAAFELALHRGHFGNSSVLLRGSLCPFDDLASLGRPEECRRQPRSAAASLAAGAHWQKCGGGHLRPGDIAAGRGGRGVRALRPAYCRLQVPLLFANLTASYSHDQSGMLERGTCRLRLTCQTR